MAPVVSAPTQFMGVPFVRLQVAVLALAVVGVLVWWFFLRAVTLCEVEVLQSYLNFEITDWHLIPKSAEAAVKAHSDVTSFLVEKEMFSIVTKKETTASDIYRIIVGAVDDIPVKPGKVLVMVTTAPTFHEGTKRTVGGFMYVDEGWMTPEKLEELRPVLSLSPEEKKKWGELATAMATCVLPSAAAGFPWGACPA
jgi:hypothetical protein